MCVQKNNIGGLGGGWEGGSAQWVSLWMEQHRTEIGVELRVIDLHQLLDLGQLLLHASLVHLKVLALHSTTPYNTNIAVQQ